MPKIKENENEDSKVESYQDEDYNDLRDSTISSEEDLL